VRIICEHLSKSYRVKGHDFPVLDDISLETGEHDFVCVLGPNGCGKTTLLKLMAGLLKPTSGAVRYADVRNSDIPVSLIFQEHGLFPWLNIFDNICFHLEMKGLPKKERYAQARPFLESMGLERFLDCYPYQLSAGMRQKAVLIRGLLMDAETLLVDEAEKSLDIYAKLVMRRDVQKAWSAYGKSVIYVTHDIDLALQIAKTIWIMGGRPARIERKIDLDAARAEQDLKGEIIASIEQLAKEMAL
jgi:NitT/TauT family transport system ATP-binding protein